MSSTAWPRSGANTWAATHDGRFCKNMRSGSTSPSAGVRYSPSLIRCIVVRNYVGEGFATLSSRLPWSEAFTSHTATDSMAPEQQTSRPRTHAHTTATPRTSEPARKMSSMFCACGREGERYQRHEGLRRQRDNPEAFHPSHHRTATYHLGNAVTDKLRHA